MIRRLALASCFLAVPFLAKAQTGGTCTAATLNGTYAFNLAGRALNSSLTLTNAYQAVGTITFDGVSAVTATVTANTNQALGTAQTLKGTYTIPSGCVGTLNFTTGDTASYTLIPFNNGHSFVITGTDATYILTGNGNPQPAACLTSTLSGSYVFSGNGYVLATAAAITGTNDISGLFQFDGAGAITGSWSTTTGAASTPDTISGKYSLAASCVGSATVTDPSGVGYTLTFTTTSADGANITLIGATPTDIFSVTAHSTFTNPGLAVGSAAGSGGVPPGSLFSIYGFNLATSTAQPTTTTYPTTLGGASITVNGEAAPLSYASPTQLNAEMPLDIVGPVATIVVKVGTATPIISNAVAAAVPATAAPGVFVSGANRAIAQNFPSYITNSPTAPAPAGSVVIVYLTGGGPVQGGSVLQTGHAAPNQSFPVTGTTSATIGGVAATVDYIGLTPGFIGLYQANLVVPKIAAGDHNLVITIGGTASPITLLSTS
jgi:uncharacterized protein (TIGR03437 family)